MQTQPTLAANPGAPDPEEAQFRARMARVGAAPAAPGRRRPGARDHRGDGFRLGWKSWLAIDAAAVLLVLTGIVAWPPIGACRQQDRTVGFYAGDSVDKCIRRGVVDRLARADQHVKMLVRGSGR